MFQETKEDVSELLVDHDNRYQRDRIVVIGRRSSGKTVYISLLYDMLWNSDGDFKMKAIKGTNHAEFIKTAVAIRQGNWPAATQGVSQAFIELDYRGQNRTMVVLDYPGEVFTDAFVRDVESKEVDALLDHMDHASAVILLVDPAHVTDGDVNSQIDNNYGILQAIDRIHNWPGGKDVPVILVFTKADKTISLFKQHNGSRAFAKKYFSSLIKTTRHLKLCKVSVMPELKQKSSLNKMKEVFALERPLVYCIERLTAIEAKADKEVHDKQIFEYCKQLEKKGKKDKVISTSLWLIFWGILYILLVWAIKAFLPSTVWSNLWYNITGK